MGSSEVSEDIAQEARYTFLRAVWRDLEKWRDLEFADGHPADIELSEPSRKRLRSVLAEVAFQTTWNVVMVIDNEEDIDGIEGAPMWRLMEFDALGAATGRDLSGLHESLMDVDPLGLDSEEIRGS